MLPVGGSHSDGSTCINQCRDRRVPRYRTSRKFHVSGSDAVDLAALGVVDGEEDAATKDASKGTDRDVSRTPGPCRRQFARFSEPMSRMSVRFSWLGVRTYSTLVPGAYLCHPHYVFLLSDRFDCNTVHFHGWAVKCSGQMPRITSCKSYSEDLAFYGQPFPESSFMLVPALRAVSSKSVSLRRELVTGVSASNSSSLVQAGRASGAALLCGGVLRSLGLHFITCGKLS